MKGLYAIVDTKLLARRGTDPLEYARAVLPARPAALQLRAKDLPARAILGLLRALGPLCRQARVPLVVNDRADLAALAGCEGVHIGQADLPYDLVHRIAPQLIVGLSTYGNEQLDRAIATRPTYLTYGPVFVSTTKSNPEPALGLEGLALAAKKARAAGIPLVATGGITLERLDDVAALADAWAVIGDLYPEGATLGDVRARVIAFQRGTPVPPATTSVAPERREGI